MWFRKFLYRNPNWKTHHVSSSSLAFKRCCCCHWQNMLVVLSHLNQNQNDAIPFEFENPLIFRVFFLSLHFQFIFCQYGKTTFQWIVAVFFSYSKCKSYHRFLWAHFICSDDKISGRWRKVKKKNNLRPKSSSVIRALQIYTLENGSRWDKINNFNMFSSSTQRMKNEKKIHPH